MIGIVSPFEESQLGEWRLHRSRLVQIANPGTSRRVTSVSRYDL